LKLRANLKSKTDLVGTVRTSENLHSSLERVERREKERRRVFCGEKAKRRRVHHESLSSKLGEGALCLV
jgi:hypothetical protein